jgi:hypothetical protein
MTDFSFHSIQTLTSLILDSNKIGAEGTQHLTDALRINTVGRFFHSLRSHTRCLHSTQTLITLHLGANEIGSEGAEYLANALRIDVVR